MQALRSPLSRIHLGGVDWEGEKENAGDRSKDLSFSPLVFDSSLKFDLFKTNSSEIQVPLTLKDSNVDIEERHRQALMLIATLQHELEMV